MDKKIICIFVSMLLCATVSAVARPMNQDINGDPVSNGLAKNAAPVTDIPVLQSSPLYKSAKAFMAYDPTGTLPQGPCEFDLGTPSTITSLASWAPGSAGFCSGAAWTLTGELFMSEYSYSNSNIYKVDPTTGDHTLIGASSICIHAMTYDVTTGIMYAAGGSVLADNLYTIDQTTGAATLVGPFGGSLAYMLMLACDGNGNMYGIDMLTDSLYSINKSNGTATLIGPTGQSQSYAQDMCYDIANDILYVAGYTDHGYLFTCNVENGSLTLVGQFQNGSEIDAFAIPFDEESPHVKIIKPEKGLYFFDKKILPRFFRPATILGNLTIEVNATDENSGIARVDFYFNGKYVTNDTSFPYTFDWRWNRPHFIHLYFIKVIAYDKMGNSAIDSIIVHKFL